MILGDDDIKAIADEVLRRLVPLLPSHQAYFQPSAVHRDFKREAEIVLETWRVKRAEENRIESEIREISQNIPEEYRPDPDQYKSRSRKTQVLAMVKDSTLWAKIPMLSKQWPSKKRTKAPQR